MKLREANIDAIDCRRRNSEDMKPVPPADEEAVAFLQAKYPRCLVYIESSYDDRARLEHSYWCNAGDWHINNYCYYVDEDTQKVYSIVDI